MGSASLAEAPSESGPLAVHRPEDDNDESNNSGDGDSDDDDDDEYADIFASIRSRTGLEIGLTVNWPPAADDDNCNTAPTRQRLLQLSTCLPPSALAPMFDGTQWAGTRVWRAAVVALQYLLHLRKPKGGELAKNDGGGCLLELGCGLGVPGMIWHSVTKDRVILTDKDDLVSQLRANLDANFNLEEEDDDDNNNNNPTSSSSRRGVIQAHPLDWSAAGVQELVRACSSSRSSENEDDENDDQHQNNNPAAASPPPFSIDIVLNCDCIYEPLYGDSWKRLLECQRELLRRHPHAYCLTSVERRRADGVDRYLEAAAAAASADDDSIERVERLHAPFPHAPQVELYRLYGKSPPQQQQQQEPPEQESPPC